MAKCDLRIELDDQQRRFKPGDTVSGTVYVEVDKDCRCDGLEITCQWATHGRGNNRSGAGASETVFRGEWKAGQTASYPFEFTLPNGPCSYHGRYLNIDWYIRARADIPWALDPKAEADFLLEPDPQAPPHSYEHGDPMRPDAAQKSQSAASEAGAGCGFFFGLVFVTAGLVPLLIAFSQGASSDVVFPALFGTVFVVVGGLFAYGSVRNKLARQKLGDIDLSLSPEACAPGDKLRLDLHMQPSSSVHLNEVRATLVGRERVVSGSGTNKSTHTQDLHEEPITLPDTSNRKVDGSMQLSADFSIPEAAPYTFYADDNELLWLVEVHIDVANWPDWVQSRYVEVRPAAQGGPERPGEDTKASAEPELQDGAVW